MATYTSNYGLHQWEPSDNFLRTDFNEDLKKIDEAIKGVETDTGQKLMQKVGLTTGVYTGNGGTQTITLGFQAKAVIVSVSSSYCHIAAQTMPNEKLWLTGNGFSVEYYSGHAYNTNEKNTKYLYLAFR